jgi:tellurite resistance protein TerA
VSCSASSSSLDACAFLVTASGRVRSDADFIFYNQPVARDGSVRHIGTSTSGTMTTEGIDLDLDAIAPDVASVFLVVSVDGGVFADVQGLSITAAARTGPIDFNFICNDPGAPP